MSLPCKADRRFEQRLGLVLSPAIRTVADASLVGPAARVEAKLVLNALRSAERGVRQRGGDLCGRGAVGGDGEGVEGLEVQGHPAGLPPPRAGRYRLAQPGVIGTADRGAPRLHR